MSIHFQGNSNLPMFYIPGKNWRQSEKVGKKSKGKFFTRTYFDTLKDSRVDSLWLQLHFLISLFPKSLILLYNIYETSALPYALVIERLFDDYRNHGCFSCSFYAFSCCFYSFLESSRSCLASKPLNSKIWSLLNLPLLMVRARWKLRS